MANDNKKISQMNFEDLQVPEFSVESDYASAFRLTDQEKAKMPAENKNLTELRIRLSEIFGERFQNYSQFEVKCDIKRSTFQKVMQFNNVRSITPQFLTKFVIGAGLTYEEANELFSLMGSPLNPERNRYAFILKCELDKKSDISELDNTLKEFGYPSLFSKAD